MPVILNLNEIKNLIQHLDVIPSMQEGFVQYSNGQTVVPPVGELLFEDPPGDVHIKYGYIKKVKQNLGSNWNIHIATSPSQVAHNCQLIVTTTPSETALFNADDIQAGTHITAVGSDTASKQELSS